MEPSRAGDWLKIKLLGTGGFGNVTLWLNSNTNQEIALKECRWGHDSAMTAKHRQRWRLEVDIMRRLNHPNVVKALEVPPELDVAGSSLPVMAMEYCKGGDLRKIINKAECCCGLPEKQVRTLLRHIVSAVEYLHCMRIIHRDLKPENIVVQERNGKFLYKLIDLGYAKELDQGSFCTSFVGTLQYLAPELFLTQTYTSAVDYWSLGLVAHEVITGQRPFLPTMSPAQWIPVVRHKTSEDIQAFLDDEGKVAFSNQISPSTQISEYLKSEIEKWLRLLLEFEPKQRGHRNGISAFQIFSQIKEQKVAQIFCLDTCTVYTYPINDSMNISCLGRCLEKDSKVAVASQLILLPKGLECDPARSAMQCWTDPEDEDNIVFLFNVTTLSQAPIFPLTTPLLVERMLRDPAIPYTYDNQKAAWREAISLSQKHLWLYNTLVQAFKISLVHLLRKNSVLHKLVVGLRRDIDKLGAKCDLAKLSLHHDLGKLVQQFNESNISFLSLQDKWNTIQTILEQIKEISEKASVVDKTSTELTAKMIEPQKSPFARTRHLDSYEESHKTILLMFEQLRKRNREERKCKFDNTEMIQLVCNILNFKESTYMDIFNSLRKLDELKLEVSNLQPEVESLSLLTERLEQKLAQAQLERQDDIWALLNDPMERINSAESASAFPLDKDQESLLGAYNNGVQMKGAMSAEDPLEDINYISSDTLLHSSLYASIDSREALSSILQHHTKDSQKVRRENLTLRNELDNMLSKMTLNIYES